MACVRRAEQKDIFHSHETRIFAELSVDTHFNRFDRILVAKAKSCNFIDSLIDSNFEVAVVMGSFQGLMLCWLWIVLY